MPEPSQLTTELVAVKPLDGSSGVPDDLSTERKVGTFLNRLLPASKGREPAAALLPWVCDRLLCLPRWDSDD